MFKNRKDLRFERKLDRNEGTWQPEIKCEVLAMRDHFRSLSRRPLSILAQP